MVSHKKTWKIEGLLDRLSLLEPQVVEQFHGEQPHAGVQQATQQESGAQLRTTCRMCAPECRLINEELEEIGEFVHQVEAANSLAREGDYSKLRALGYRNLESAKDVPKEMGLRGRLPWAAPYYKNKLSYIHSLNFVLLPPAHLLLHGLVKSLWALAAGKVSGWERGKDTPFVLSHTAVKQFKVLSLSSSSWLRCAR